MIREIKFRAWDKENEEYINGYDVLLKYDGSVISRYALATFDTNMPVNVIIEQYTGLKDKNGKEIYEVDIVKVGHLRPRFEVTHNVPCTKFWMENNELVEEFENWNEETGIEVIGNIHENSELLGGKNE